MTSNPVILDLRPRRPAIRTVMPTNVLKSADREWSSEGWQILTLTSTSDRRLHAVTRCEAAVAIISPRGHAVIVHDQVYAADLLNVLSPSAMHKVIPGVAMHPQPGPQDESSWEAARCFHAAVQRVGADRASEALRCARRSVTAALLTSGVDPDSIGAAGRAGLLNDAMAAAALDWLLKAPVRKRGVVARWIREAAALAEIAEERGVDGDALAWLDRLAAGANAERLMHTLVAGLSEGEAARISTNDLASLAGLVQRRWRVA